MRMRVFDCVKGSTAFTRVRLTFDCVKGSTAFTRVRLTLVALVGALPLLWSSPPPTRRSTTDVPAFGMSNGELEQSSVASVGTKSFVGVKMICVWTSPSAHVPRNPLGLPTRR